MREIEFRGKQANAINHPLVLSNSTWVFGYLTGICYIYSEELCGEMLVDENTIGQYIGKKDRNGIKIFDGDKLDIDEYPFTSDGIKNYYGVVKWDTEDCLFYIRCFKYDKSKVKGISEGNCYNIGDFEMVNVEVIGNIYDNEDLLEGE